MREIIVSREEEDTIEILPDEEAVISCSVDKRYCEIHVWNNLEENLSLNEGFLVGLARQVMTDYDMTSPPTTVEFEFEVLLTVTIY